MSDARKAKLIRGILIACIAGAVTFVVHELLEEKL